MEVLDKILNSRFEYANTCFINDFIVKEVVDFFVYFFYKFLWFSTIKINIFFDHHILELFSLHNSFVWLVRPNHWAIKVDDRVKLILRFHAYLNGFCLSNSVFLFFSVFFYWKILIIKTVLFCSFFDWNDRTDKLEIIKKSEKTFKKPIKGCFFSLLLKKVLHLLTRIISLPLLYQKKV